MRKKAQKEQNWQKVNDQRAGLRHKLNEAEDKLGARPQAAVPPMLRPAKKGDTVTILKTGTQASVLSVNKDGVLQLHRRSAPPVCQSRPGPAQSYRGRHSHGPGIHFRSSGIPAEGPDGGPAGIGGEKSRPDRHPLVGFRNRILWLRRENVFFLPPPPEALVHARHRRPVLCRHRRLAPAGRESGGQRRSGGGFRVRLSGTGTEKQSLRGGI